MLKAVCISNFNYYQLRLEPVEKLLEKRGYDVTYVTGDYDTMIKQHYTMPQNNVVQLPIKPYEKNISLRRIASHLLFARAVYRYLEEVQPDVIYAMVPPNFVAYYVAKYKKKHPEVKVICDVFDMWPESFPSQKAKGMLKIPFALWQNLRTRSLAQVDGIVTECQLFEERLARLLPQKASVMRTVHPYKDLDEALICPNLREEVLEVCYLGSINNIIDIERIANLLGQLTRLKPVHCHIIGNGERKAVFLKALSQAGVSYTDYGNVYDPIQKQAIFDRCAFGLNILKPSVFIGLTLKTLDYLKGGLPLLNTIPQDTASWVKAYGIGFNLSDLQASGLEAISQLSLNQLVDMKYQARRVFEEHLTQAVYVQKMQEVFDQVGLEEV